MATRIKIVDTHFAHATVMSSYDPGVRSEIIDWYRGDDPHRLTVFTDSCLDRVDVSESEFNVAWLLESPLIARQAYSRIRKNYRKFDRVMTFDKELLGLGELFVFCPLGGCWIDPAERRLHEKSQMLSAIVSFKRQTVGQKLRHKVVKQIGDALNGHLYGRGSREIANKLEGLAPYRYTIVIENGRMDYYFTEKLIDALVTGTVPIYWGCPDIGRFFDLDGIIPFQKPRQLRSILASLSEEDYERRREAVVRNLERAKRYCMIEDGLWEHCLKELA